MKQRHSWRHLRPMGGLILAAFVALFGNTATSGNRGGVSESAMSQLNKGATVSTRPGWVSGQYANEELVLIMALSSNGGFKLDAMSNAGGIGLNSNSYNQSNDVSMEGLANANERALTEPTARHYRRAERRRLC